MMGSKRIAFLLAVLFLLVFAVRLYIAFSSPYLSDDASYFHLRQVEHIRDTGVPIFSDDLSFSGRDRVFSPVFHYLVAGTALFLPSVVAAKLVTNFFAALLVFFVYLLVNYLTKDSFVSLSTAFLSGFVPVFFAETVNSLNPLCVVIPLMFLMMYAFLNVEDKHWLYCYLVLLVVLTAMHPLVLLFALGLFFYLAILLIERLRYRRAEIELSLFSIFFILWAHFIIFKKLVVFHGPAVIWQNIPPDILNNYFAKLSILQAIYFIGILPFVLGLYMIYLYSFKKKDRQIYFVMSFAASAGLLLWLRLINLEIGLMFFGVVLVILFGSWFSYFIGYVRQSRASNFLYFFVGIIFIGFLLLSVYPSLQMARAEAEGVSSEEIAALVWIKNNTPDDAVILATPEEGNLIAAVAERKNVIDDRFLLQQDAKQRFQDVGRVFTAALEIEVVSILDKYDAGYIYFSGHAEDLFGVEKLGYANRCFETVYDSGIQVYERKGCQLKVIE